MRCVRFCSLGPSPRRPTASCSLTPERRGDCGAHRGCIRSPTHRSLLVLLGTSYCCCTRPALLSHIFTWLKDDAIFRFDTPMGRVVGFWAKIRRLGSSDYQILSRRNFAKSDCISRPFLVSDRKIKIESSESGRIRNSLRPFPMQYFFRLKNGPFCLFCL